LIEANSQDVENKLWQRWLVDYARMDGKTFIGFKDYKKGLLKAPSCNEQNLYTTKTKEEIFAQSEKIIAAWKKGGENCGTI
jgi:hypothetical protein